MVGFVHIFNNIPFILHANMLQGIWSFHGKMSNSMNECNVDGDSILDPQVSIMNQGEKLTCQMIRDFIVAKVRHP